MQQWRRLRIEDWRVGNSHPIETMNVAVPGKARRSATLCCACMVGALALVAGVTPAQAQVIFDPENPAFGETSEPDEPSPPPARSGVIADPENPAFSGGGEPDEPATGSTTIADPENPAFSGEQEREQAASGLPDLGLAPLGSSSSGGGRPVIFRGQLQSSGAVDLRRDNPYENTVESFHDFSMRVRIEPNDKWTVVMEGVLSWWITGSSPEERPAIAPSDWQGNFEARLGDFFVATRFGDWSLRIGNQSVVWGSSDILKPADIINPRDYRRGLVGSSSDQRLPIPAVTASYLRERFEAQFVLVPFFVPHRVAVYGNDYALATGGSPLAGTLPIEPLAGLFLDDSLEDIIQPVLLQTELPEELPRSASLGTRISANIGGSDLALGYFFGWDRIPEITLHPELRAGLAQIPADALGPDANLSDLGPALAPLLGRLPALQSAAERGETIFRSRYRRRHFIEADGVSYIGPVGIRYEALFSPLRTLYTDDLESFRAPAIVGTFGLSYEGLGEDLLLTTEFFAQHIFDEREDIAFFGQTYTGISAAFFMSGGLFGDEVARGWENLQFGSAVFYAFQGRDLLLSPSLEYRVNERFDITMGAVIVASFNDETESVGDVLDTNDQFFVRLNTTF